MQGFSGVVQGLFKGFQALFKGCNVCQGLVDVVQWLSTSVKGFQALFKGVCLTTLGFRGL